MIESIVLDYLSKKLDEPCFMEEQLGKLDKYVLIEKTGGGEENHLQFASIAVSSHAATLIEAAQLNKKVKDAMKNIISLNSVSKCKLNSDYNFTDPTKKQYRYLAVFDLVFFI